MKRKKGRPSSYKVRSFVASTRVGIGLLAHLDRESALRGWERSRYLRYIIQRDKMRCDSKTGRVSAEEEEVE
jgi:hypothetical protein